MKLHPELWSSGVLLSEGGDLAIRNLHKAYIDAGADIITAVTYQSSIPALKKTGLSEQESFRAITRPVEIAKEEALKVSSNRKVYVAAGLGPYGAYLSNGEEYTGDYGDSATYDVLKEFWVPRVQAVMAAQPDILLFETIPNITEITVILNEIAPLANRKRIPVWMSLSLHIPSGPDIGLADRTSILQLAKVLDAPNQGKLQMIGANCFDVRAVPRVISALQCTKLPILVYPNSGEVYNGIDKSWHTLHDTELPSELWQPAKWVARGASVVGGCCRTTPEIIRDIGINIRQS